MEVMPEWMINLEEEDLNFIKNFVLSSGSLKKLAKEYSVTYPTVRLRLDKLIVKITNADKMDKDDYVALVKRLAFLCLNLFLLLALFTVFQIIICRMIQKIRFAGLVLPGIIFWILS